MWAGDAFNSGKKKEITRPGIAYMLQGGSDESNTDPNGHRTGAGRGMDRHAGAHHAHRADAAGHKLFHNGPYIGGYPYIMWAGRLSST